MFDTLVETNMLATTILAIIAIVAALGAVTSLIPTQVQLTEAYVPSAYVKHDDL
ncbi:MAG: hypothetical protein WBZ36_04605 [Candidatus Nitrosopolaris sp.]